MVHYILWYNQIKGGNKKIIKKLIWLWELIEYDQGHIRTRNGTNNIQANIMDTQKKYPQKWRSGKQYCCCLINFWAFLLLYSAQKNILYTTLKKWLEVRKQYKSIKFCWYWGKLTRPLTAENVAPTFFWVSHLMISIIVHDPFSST